MTRYLATMTFYIDAESDKKAFDIAEDVTKKQRELYNDSAEIVELGIITGVKYSELNLANLTEDPKF